MFHLHVHVIVAGVKPKSESVVTLNVYYFLTNKRTRFGNTTRFRFLASSVERLLRMCSEK